MALICLCTSAFITLQVPYVQNRLFQKLLQHLSHTTHFTITHQRFQLTWLQNISLTGLRIKDPQDNALLHIAQLTVKINPLQLFMRNHIILKAVRIANGRLSLCKKEETEDYNLAILLHRLLGKATTGAAKFAVERASLQNIEVSMDDQQAVPLQGRFDPYHFTLHQINAELAHLKAEADTFSVALLQLSGKQAGKPLCVDHFTTSLHVAPGNIQCKALQLATGQSAIKGNCTITYDPAAPKEALGNSIHIASHLDSSTIASEELAVFLPYFKQHKVIYTLCADLEGGVDDLHFNDLRLTFGERGSLLKGCLRLQGLPNTKAVVFDVALAHGEVHVQDLRPYLNKAHYAQIAPLHAIRTKGRFQGTRNAFTAQATLDTNLGRVSANLKLQISPTDKPTKYKGTIATKDFDVGALLNNSALQKLTMQGEINGEGVSFSKARFQLAAHVKKLGFNHYNYGHIHANGRFSNASFQGKLTVHDPHLKLQAEGTIDLSDGTNKRVAIQGTLDDAWLQPLGLTDKRAWLSSEFAMAMRGPTWNEVQGNGQLNHLCFGIEDKEVVVGTLNIRADEGKQGRLLEVDSPLVALKAEGDFAYTTLVRDFTQFIQAYQQRLTHTVLPHQQRTARPYALAYQLHCKDINPLLQVFTDDVYVTPGAKIEGDFAQDKTETTFSLRLAEVEEIAFQQHCWTGTQMELFASKAKDSQPLSATVRITSKEQHWSAHTITENLALALSWENNQIDFTGILGRPDSPNQIDLQGAAVLMDNTVAITLHPSLMKLAGNQWHIHPENCITLGKSWTKFEQLEIASGAQQISLAGILSANNSEVLSLNVKAFSLANLAWVLGTNLSGELNATAVLRGLLGQSHIDSDITIQDFAIDNFSAGDIHAQTHWDNALARLTMACQVDHLGQQPLSIAGCYQPKKEKNSLQLVVHLADTPLALLAPFVEEELSQLTGGLSGTLHISGTPASPCITGTATLADATVRVNYLNTLYRAHGALTFAEEAINIAALTLRDDQEGEAALQGVIAHQQFSDFQVDLTGSMDRFKLLDTTAEGNEYFYGTGITSGSLVASGPIDHITIAAQTKTDPGTRIYIPLGRSSTTALQEGFIRFVNFKQQAKLF